MAACRFCSRRPSRDRLRSTFPEVALRRSIDSDGFTVIELMVVVTTMLLLIGIAIPTFLGFRGNAQDRSAQVTLTTAEKVTYLVIIEQGDVPKRSVLLTLLPTLEPVIDWVDHKDSSTGPAQVSIDDDKGQQLTLAALSESGTCYYVRVMVDSPPMRGFVEGAANCESHDYENGADTGW